MLPLLQVMYIFHFFFFNTVVRVYRETIVTSKQHMKPINVKYVGLYMGLEYKYVWNTKNCIYQGDLCNTSKVHRFWHLLKWHIRRSEVHEGCCLWAQAHPQTQKETCTFLPNTLLWFSMLQWWYTARGSSSDMLRRII